MELSDFTIITNGVLSICDTMIGDDKNDQQDKLTKADISAKYLVDASLILEGNAIHRIELQMTFSAYPYAMVDSFLGVAKEMSETGVITIEPQWKDSGDSLTNQYRVHNLLYDVEVNVRIASNGATDLSLELSASHTNEEGELPDDAIGVYKNINELVRSNKDLEEHLRNPKPNTIFF